jgi:EF-P beta-lysylation protein EpmB
MITGNVIKNQFILNNQQKNPHGSAWQQSLGEAFRTPKALLDYLDLDAGLLTKSDMTTQDFPLRVPLAYAKRIQKGDWSDPLLRQVIPLDNECIIAEGFTTDPVGDIHATKGLGILQKYSGRALIITTGACAIHCRYCFRRHFPYQQHHASKNQWDEIILQIQSDSSLSEIILSGGDPLTLSDERLKTLCNRLAAIPHIERIRFHTRLPIVLPERIDAGFINWFGSLSQQTDLQIIMVIHANHANEFDLDVKHALEKLRATDTLLFNQSVLLRGINDNSNTLIHLSETLIEHHVFPYYLHMLDPVQGSTHFEVAETKALQLIRELRNTLPGYMVPKLVRELSGKRSKSPIV